MQPFRRISDFFRKSRAGLVRPPPAPVPAPVPAPPATPQSHPILYGIVVDLEGRHYVETFNLMPNIGYIPYYTSQNSDMMIQVSFDPRRMSDTLRMNPRPVAKIEHDVSDANPNANPTARLSKIEYLYSSLDDANERLHPIHPIAVLARSHPNKSVSNHAKTFLQPTSLTSQQRRAALAQGGINDVLSTWLIEGMPNQKPNLMHNTKRSMLRSEPPNGGSRRRSKSRKYNSRKLKKH
jgi:hypothetical protein